MKLILLASIGIIGSQLLSSCATKSSSPGKDAVSSSASVEPASGELIVTQTKSRVPIISGSSMEHWVQLKNTENSANRFYGYMATGEWATAIEEVKRAIEQKPGDTALIVALAVSYAGQGNYEMSGYYAGLVLRADAANADALNLIGLRTMTGSGNRRADYDDALSWFRRASENDGTHIAALLNMGNLLLDLGDSAAATDAFTAASNRCGQCFPAQYGLGVASTRTGAWQQATKIFETILGRDRSKAEAHYQLALVYKNGFANQPKAIQLLQDIVSDADGRFKHAGSVKRVANITLRRMKANDRTAPMPEEALEPR